MDNYNLLTILIVLLIFYVAINIKNKTAMFAKQNNIFIGEESNDSKKKMKKRIAAGLTLLLILATLANINVKTTVKMDIMTATPNQLMLINGLGEYKANVIYEYIHNNGLEYYEELLIIDGIGEGTVEKLKKYTKIEKSLFGGD